jgi:cell wall-associated NlpC family hydrolase
MLAASLAACAATGAIPRPFPTPGPLPDPSTPTEAVVLRALDPTASIEAVVRRALDLQGTPYRAGGTDPGGFDCSGLVQYVFAQEGILLPRTVTEQMAMSREVSSGDVVPGDLLFFRVDGSKPSHVGIAVGTDAFVHAPRERGVVRVERFHSRYWQERFVAARRAVPMVHSP